MADDASDEKHDTIGSHLRISGTYINPRVSMVNDLDAAAASLNVLQDSTSTKCGEQEGKKKGVDC
jgi:hypothetical protein